MTTAEQLARQERAERWMDGNCATDVPLSVVMATFAEAETADLRASLDAIRHFECVRGQDGRCLGTRGCGPSVAGSALLGTPMRDPVRGVLRAALEAAQAEAAEFRRAVEAWRVGDAIVGPMHEVLRHPPGSRDALDAALKEAFRAGWETRDTPSPANVGTAYAAWRRMMKREE